MQKLTYGSITFSGVSSFMQGVPTQIGAVQPYPSFVTGPGSQTLDRRPTTATISQRDYHFKTFGFYVQDDYRWKPRVTLNLGLRYEFMTTPQDVDGRQSYIPQLADLHHLCPWAGTQHAGYLQEFQPARWLRLGHLRNGPRLRCEADSVSIMTSPISARS